MKIDDPFITSDTQFDIRTSKSFIKVNSQSGISKSKKINKLTSLKELDYKADENFGPLSNVRDTRVSEEVSVRGWGYVRRTNATKNEHELATCSTPDRRKARSANSYVDA
uniref:Uncharacterized protein n=1 Tax=Trichogramma kaykai TaxID=54128 RepID=A0ABD2W504_9HYME